MRALISRYKQETGKLTAGMYCIVWLMYMDLGSVSLKQMCSSQTAARALNCGRPHGPSGVRCNIEGCRRKSKVSDREEQFTYWLMRRISTVLRSNSSKNGRAENPSFAGCMPASSYIGHQLIVAKQGGKLHNTPSLFSLCTE